MAFSLYEWIMAKATLCSETTQSTVFTVRQRHDSSALLYFKQFTVSRLAMLIGWEKGQKKGPLLKRGTSDIWVTRSGGLTSPPLNKKHKVAERSGRAILPSGYNSPVSRGNNIRRSISDAELLYVYTVNMLSLVHWQITFWCNEWWCVRTLYKSGFVLAESERNKSTSYKASYM